LKYPGWRHPSDEWVRQAERLVALDGKLPAVLKGEAQPADAAERVALAELCWRWKERHAAAARLYVEAFRAAPKLADDPQEFHRSNAACAAALAGAGTGEGGTKLTPAERARWRKQALDWLKADLALRAKAAADGTAEVKARVRAILVRWQRDSDLAGIRDAAGPQRPARGGARRVRAPLGRCGGAPGENPRGGEAPEVTRGRAAASGP